MSDRPLECSNCQKAIKVIYKEIDQQSENCMHMCSDCPILQQKLHGKEDFSEATQWEGHPKGLCCVRCGTSLESFALEGVLGCSECYEIFENLITEKLFSEGLIPERFKESYQKNRGQSFHVGHVPHEVDSTLLSNTVTDLNEALNDALQKENYEQAAQLRDQIKQLMEEPNERPQTS